VDRVLGGQRADGIKKNRASLDPAALLCLWRDVMGYSSAEKKTTKKLASRCCTNVRKQHLYQNDINDFVVSE